ncbi:mannose-1-phosphate guanylyltransferase [Negadavirga shengliensis]|uniref:Mannose-1-phosphate guanylyltransferase n=1 Tax=Negadavirga shengliensis TaxID=1389218 RepID=A0ABV9T2A4_9BACT
MNIVNVILSGGIGSRLWPLSRKSRPKQYLPIFDNKSLFELTVERNKGICDKLMVVGGIDNYQLSRDCLHSISPGDYLELVEALPRNTAAAIAFAALSLDPEDIMLVTPSDHLISNQPRYEKALRKAVELAKEGYLVTFGLLPARPETGFGYIEHRGNEVVSFREKPDLELAEEFVRSGNFLWNSGMFCFSANIYLQELKIYEPALLDAAQKALAGADNGFLPLEPSKNIPSISVDYAVMERSKKIKVVPSDFTWSDMGSFEALYEHIGEGDPRRKGSNLVLGSEKRVEFLGMENVILVETSDAILVLNKEKAQDVKKIYEQLEKENPELLH